MLVKVLKPESIEGKFMSIKEAEDLTIVLEAKGYKAIIDEDLERTIRNNIQVDENTKLEDVEIKYSIINNHKTKCIYIYTIVQEEEDTHHYSLYIPIDKDSEYGWGEKYFTNAGVTNAVVLLKILNKIMKSRYRIHESKSKYIKIA